MEYRLKDINLYVQERVIHWAICYNLRLVRNKLLEAPAYIKLVYLVSIKIHYALILF